MLYRARAAGQTFQSTRPRRARLRDIGCCLDIFSVSIHAPTQGATLYNDHAVYLPDVSIHAPTQGATLLSYPGYVFQVCFNPRAHAGRD